MKHQALFGIIPRPDEPVTKHRRPLTYRRQRRRLAAVGVIALLLAVAIVSAAAAPAVFAKPVVAPSLPPITEPPEDPPDDPPDDPPPPPVSFDYSMPDRFGGDSNGDGLMDYYTPSDVCAADNAATCTRRPPTNPNPISPSTWHVDLNACFSALAQGTNVTYVWQVVGGVGTISGGPGCNQWDLTVANEGKYTLQLTLTSSLGAATVTKDVIVQDFLIVALGDSYGSGEGSPDQDMVRGFAGIKVEDPKWQDRRCHRSARAGSAQAARMIEQADPHTSVTFITTACSGAEILNGFLNPYDGVDSTWEAKYNAPLQPQLTQARNLIGGREVDALYMSVGGNDANFAKIVTACLAQSPCNPQHMGLPDIVYPDLTVPAACTTALLIPPPAGVIVAAVCAVTIASLLVGVSGATAEHWFDQGIRGSGTNPSYDDYRLTTLYGELQSRLHATSPGPNGEPYLGLPAQYNNRVFLSEYVDATHDDDGSYCPKNDLFKLTNDIRVPGLTDYEYSWLDTQVEQKLNSVIARNTQLNGWNLVDGVHSRFRNHGLCADDTYFTGLLVDTFWREDDMHGAVHPNPNGQQVFRDRIISKMLPTLYPGSGGENLDIRRLADAQSWVANHTPRLPVVAPTPSAAIGDATVTEGNTGTVAMNFPVSLSATSANQVSVNYAVANGSAKAPGDYVAATGTVAFAPGETSKNLTVLVNGDALDEANETLNVTLSSPVGTTIGDGNAVGKIIDDDPTPSLRITDVKATEGQSGTKNFTFKVSLSAASGRAVKVNWTTANGTALAGSDYVAANGQVTIPAGATSVNVVVKVKGDTAKEPNQTFNVKLATPVNATIADSIGLGTIVNDD